MKLAPVDVTHKSFGNKVWGFNPEEVQSFLRDVADQMEDLIRERNSLKEALREKDLSIHDYKQRDETLKATITTATKMAEQVRMDAEREARLVIQDAQQRGDLIMKDARDQLRRTYQEIADLKRLRLQFETTMKSLLYAHQQMIDQANAILPDLPAAPAGMHANTSNSTMSAGANSASAAPAPATNQSRADLMFAAGAPTTATQPSSAPTGGNPRATHTPIAPLSQLNGFDFADSGTPIRPSAPRAPGKSL